MHKGGGKEPNRGGYIIKCLNLFLKIEYLFGNVELKSNSFKSPISEEHR